MENNRLNGRPSFIANLVAQIEDLHMLLCVQDIACAIQMVQSGKSETLLLDTIL